MRRESDMTARSRNSMRPSCANRFAQNRGRGATLKLGRGATPRGERGMPGARCTRSPCAKGSKHTVVTTGSPDPRHSLRSGFNGFLRALPGDRLVATVARGKNTSPRA